MRCQLDDLHARGVPLAGLGASEAGIYGRFGYGAATWDSSWRLARGAARGLADGDDGCYLDMIGARQARELLPAVHEQARRGQVGDVRTYPGRWHDLAGDGAPPGTLFLLCRDYDGHPAGYAIYRIQREERYTADATVIVDHLIALTGAAYRRLWAHLANLDLTSQVIASGRPEHEPLRWALADSRQLTVTGVHDHLWLRLIDLPEALSRRRYAAEGSLIMTSRTPSARGTRAGGCWKAVLPVPPATQPGNRPLPPCGWQPLPSAHCSWTAHRSCTWPAPACSKGTLPPSAGHS